MLDKLLKEATSVEDLNSLMRLMMKSATEQMLDTEMDVHLGRASKDDESQDGGDDDGLVANRLVDRNQEAKAAI